MTNSPLLNMPLPPEIRAEWAEHLARPDIRSEDAGSVVMIFRLGAERFALPIEHVREVAPMGVIRPLPHARDGLIQGITNIHGRIQICVRLERLLQVLPAQASELNRLLVIMQDGWCVAAMVDEVMGAETVTVRDQSPLPSTHSGAVYADLWLEKWQTALLNASSLLAALRQHLR